MDSEAILVLIGVYLFYLGCKNIISLHKERSIILKILICFGLFFVSLLLGTSFVFLINPKISPFLAGRFLFILIGIVAEIISLLFKCVYYHKKEENKEDYTSAKRNLVVIILIPLIVLFFFYGADVYQEVNCSSPQMLIGERCCIPNTDFGILMCSDDVISLSHQLDNAIKNDEITIAHRENITNSFNILIPEGYYALKNSKIGSYDLPMYLLSYGDDYETPLIFNSIYFEDVEGSIYEKYDYFYDGLSKTISLHSVNTELTNPSYFSSNEGIDFFILNMTKSINGEKEKTSVAFMTKDGKNLIIFFTSYEPYFSAYYSEFEDMVHSIKRVS